LPLPAPPRISTRFSNWMDGIEDHSLVFSQLTKVKSVGAVLGQVENPFVPADPKKVVVVKGSSADTVTDGDW
jgi:hypothetical protein